MSEKKNKIEVLAPAGGEEALKAAVFCGADAVYLGGSAFGARANAQNFDNEALQKAVYFCHGRGVKVYVTVNTVLKDTEIPQALAFVEFLCALPVDAVLVQDMGLFSLLHEAAPLLPLHASTQMSLHTPDGAALLYALGAKRAVLSRELSLDEIEEISSECPIELETFVHGALCMSVSGQCYFSAMLGGRSGNRGMCAQPCRLPFAAKGGTGYDLSLKDLSFLGEVNCLLSAGVCSAKIEGRMKRPEYVAAAVSACRLAADGKKIPAELLKNLEAVFSRSGFTRGYLTGKTGAKMFGVRTKEDVAGATQKVFSDLRGLYRTERGDIPISMELDENRNQIFLVVCDKDGNKVTSRAEFDGTVVPLTQERSVAQLAKTGGTPFVAERITFPEQGVHLALSGLNALRREAVEALLARREKLEPIPFSKIDIKADVYPRRAGKELPVRAAFANINQLCEEAKRCEAVFLPISTEISEIKKARDSGFERIILELPRSMFGAQKLIEGLVASRMEQGFTEFMCGNLGAVETVRKAGGTVHGSFSLNVTNSASLNFFAYLGLQSAELSFELTANEICALSGTLSRGAMIYGRQALMLVRNCPIANSKAGCLNCKTPQSLRDRMHKNFPVKCTRLGGLKSIEVLNSVPLCLFGEAALKAVDFGIMRFTVENSVECSSILTAFFRHETPQFDCTRGLFYRGVE